MVIKKAVLVWVFFIGMGLEAQSLHYVARGTLVGTIIDAKVHYKANSKRYTIRVDMKATGLIKLMSGGQIEHHSSYGSVRHGEYYAKEYKIDKTYKDIHYIRRYLFDYKKKKITKISIKWKKEKKLYENKEVLKYFAHNDILTLYHNSVKYKKKHPSGHFSVALAGAEKEGGKLILSFPAGKKLQEERNAIGEKSAAIIKVYMKRAFLSGGRGSLTFAIDKNGMAKKVILDSVKLLGKVTLKRVR